MLTTGGDAGRRPRARQMLTRREGLHRSAPWCSWRIPNVRGRNCQELYLDAGSAPNFTDSFTNPVPAALKTSHRRTARFLGRSNYAQVIYNPLLRSNFACSIERRPTSFSGCMANRRHILTDIITCTCAPTCLFSYLIPTGQQVRRNFSFWPSEKAASPRIPSASRSLAPKVSAYGLFLRPDAMRERK